jgi:hypothetical protein
VIVLTDAFTGQSAIINVPPDGIVEGKRVIDAVTREVPSLGSKAVIAHIITKDDSSPEQQALNDDIYLHIESCGVRNIKAVQLGEDVVVGLHSGDGKVEITALHNSLLYVYQPLSPQTQAPPAPGNQGERN